MADFLDNQDEQGVPPLPGGYVAVKKESQGTPPLPSGYVVKKKESSESTSQKSAGESPTKTTQKSTSSDTEPPTRAQASVALGGPTKLFGQEEEKRPTSIMYGNEPKKEEFVPPSTPIDIDQSIKYLEKTKSNPKELKRLKEKKAKMPTQKPIEYYLNKQIVSNLTPAIDQANTITEEDKSERDSSFETDWNKTGFVNKLKQLGSDILGTSVNLFNKLGLVDESMTKEDIAIEPLKKYKDQVIKYATENKIKLSPEQFKSKVQEMYNDDWDTDKKAYNLQQLNYTLNDEEQKAIGEDTFNKYKDLNTSQKYFLNTSSTLSKVRDNIGLDLVNLDKQLSEKIKNDETLTETEIKSYNDLTEKYKQYHLDAQNAYGKYAKNLDKVHSLETELDVFDNENLRSLEFLKRLGIATEQLGVGAIDFTSYLANLYSKSSPLTPGREVSMYLHQKANDLRGAIEEQNKGLRDTSNRFESVLSKSVDFITENTPMVLGLVYGGAPAMYGLAGTTAGEKYGEMLNENKDYNEFQEVVAPLLHGGAMLIPLSKQLKTIQNSGRVLLAGEKEFPKIIENVYKEKAANLFGKIKTFAGESFDLGNQLKLMTVLQEVNNSVVLGKDVDYKKLLDLEVYATAPLLHGMNKVAPYLAGKVTEPFMSKEDYSIIDENTRQIFDLNKKLESGELDINEADIVKQTIKDISAKSAEVVNNKLDRIGKYSKETVDNILDATKQASDLREKANRIISSENIDAKQKEVLVKNLRGEYNSIEQTKAELISGNAKNIIYVKKETDIPIEADRVKGAQYKVVENSIEKKLFEKQQMSVNAPAVEVKAEEITTTEVAPTEAKAEEVKPAEDIEAKKADIEKRREEELKSIIQTQPIEVLDEKGNVIATSDKTVEINAKYDAELKALEEVKPTETKTVTHNEIEYAKNEAGNWVNTKTGNEIKGIGEKGKELIKTLDDLAKPAEIKEIVAPKEDLTAGKGLFSEPVEHVIKAAEDYKKSKGITVDAGERITDIDVENSKKIADAYDEMQSNPNDPEVKAAYNAMANETMDQFKHLIDNGYTVELYDGKTEPYKNSEEMLKDLRDNKHLYVFSTEEGFGDTPITEKDRQENPLLKDSGFTDKNGKKLLINDAFRFVHDIFGHGERGNSFGPKGEENAWDVHSRMYSPEARRAMTTETRGQNSWVNFNKEMRNEDGSIKKKGDKGYLSPTERPFADQKIGLLPEWVSKSIYETTQKPTEKVVSEKKIAEATKKLADKVREIKVSRPDIFSSGTPGSLAWDLGVEAVAKSIEITGDIAQAVSDGLEAIKKTDWYKGLDNDKKTIVEEEFRKKFNSIKEPITEEPKKENIVKRTVKSFFENDIAPMFKSTAEAVTETTKAVVNALSPKTGVGKEVVTKFYELVGDRNKSITLIDKQIGEYKKTFDKMPDAERIDFIDRMKAGKPQDNPELDAIAKVISKLDKDLYDEITKYNPNLAWKENHFRVLWKKVPGTEKEKYWSFLSKRPVRGSRGFFGQSTLRSMSEGIEKGGVPYSTNPIEMFEMSYNDGMKYVTAQRIIDSFKKDGIIKFVKSGQDVPDGYTKINDSVANVYFKTDQGMVKTGEYWIQEDPGRMLNNMLSRDYIRDTKLGTSLMGIKNFYTAIELGLSPFHAVAISLEQIASGAGIGLRKIINLGDVKGGIKDVLTAPFSPKTTFSLGRKYFKFATAKEFENSPEGKSFLQKNPRAKEYLDDFFQGGGLVKQHDDLKNNAYKALKENMGKDNYIGAGLRALPALNEGVMDPLFNVYIPSLKIGLFMKEFPLILAENKSRLDSGKVTREELSRKTIDGIDNRLGEMNFDNLYWNKTFKTSMQFMLRSVTWKLGNIRQMGGAAPEQAIEFVNAIKENRRPNLSPKMAWLFGLSLTQVVLASVIQHMSLDDDDKDKEIKDFKDIVAPRINSADNKERVVIPTYYKDLLHFWHAPTEYVSSGVSGPFGKGVELYNNEDFYKYNIYDETDPVYKQLIDAGKYAAPKPFSITSFQKMREKGEPVSKQALSFMGFNKAPGYLEHSDLESEILDLYSIRNTSVKPLKMKEANDKKKEIREMYKKDISKAQEMANEAVKEGLLKPTQVTRLFRDVAKNEDAMVFFFKRLPESDKEYLATKMTEEEKKKFNIKKKLTDAEFKEKYGEKAFKQLLRARELSKKGAK